MKKQLLAGLAAIAITGTLSAQNLTPVAVTGFVHDGITDTYPDTQQSTDTVLDGSAYVLYPQSLATANSFTGGLPNNGQISAASNTRQWQLQPSTGNNIMNMMRGVTRFFTLVTPASYQQLSLLVFSTEGDATLKVTVEFSDGSQTVTNNNVTVPDWFGTTANTAYAGMGRITRTTAATTGNVNGPTTNPKIFYVDVNIPCADRPKTISKIYLTNTTTTGTNAPYPNLVCLGVAGAGFTQVLNANSTNAACGINSGSATFAIGGSTAPYTVTWNTTPVSSASTLVNLAPGAYTATATDATGCVYSRTFNIIMAPLPTVTVTATPSSVCPGNPSLLSVTATNGTLATYNWSPGGATSPTVNVTPTTATTYTVTGVDANGCSYSASSTVNMNPLPANPVVTGGIGCLGGTATFNISNPVAGATYNWYNVATGGQIVNTGTSFNISNLAAGNTYYVNVTTGGCTSLRQPTAVQLLPQPQVNAGPDVTIITGDQIQLQGTAAPGSYVWTPATALNASNVLNPFASPTTTTTYTLSVTNSQGCTASDAVLITVIPNCIKPMVAFTPNGDGMNDVWRITDGSCSRNAVVRVYNRYGGEVYANDSYSNNWDGTYKGKTLPDGTYYFVITYYLINGKKALEKGNVTILR